MIYHWVAMPLPNSLVFFFFPNEKLDMVSFVWIHMYYCPLAVLTNKGCSYQKKKKQIKDASLNLTSYYWLCLSGKVTKKKRKSLDLDCCKKRKERKG